MNRSNTPNYKMIIITILLLQSWNITHGANSNRPIPFNQLWQLTQNNSEAIKASSNLLAAQEISLARSQRHWLPKLYLQGGYTHTDNPIYSFMGNLGQRSVTATDFIPAHLNNPDANSYHQLNINTVLPLYEGGMKEAIKQARKHQLNQKKFEDSAIRVDVYEALAKLYGLSLIARDERGDISSHLAELNRILSMYRIGSKNNPLGHSGLLGLKSLKARLVALQAANHALNSTVTNSITTLSGTPFTIQHISTATLASFIKQNLGEQQNINNFNGSYKVLSLQEMAYAANMQKNAEQARFRPQLALFAQESFNHGDRDTESAYTVGLKLSWQLYNGEDQGAKAEAALKAKAASYYSKAKLTQEKMQIERHRQELTALKSGLKQLSSIKHNLTKQVKITHRLFLNGVINALQLTEVLSRFLDVTQQIKSTKERYLSSSIELHRLTSDLNS